MREPEIIDAEFEVVGEPTSETSGDPVREPRLDPYQLIAAGIWVVFCYWAYPKVQSFFDQLFFG